MYMSPSSSDCCSLQGFCLSLSSILISTGNGMRDGIYLQCRFTLEQTKSNVTNDDGRGCFVKSTIGRIAYPLARLARYIITRKNANADSDTWFDSFRAVTMTAWQSERRERANHHQHSFQEICLCVIEVGRSAAAAVH